MRRFGGRSRSRRYRPHFNKRRRWRCTDHSTCQLLIPHYATCNVFVKYTIIDRITCEGIHVHPCPLRIPTLPAAPAPSQFCGITRSSAGASHLNRVQRRTSGSCLRAACGKPVGGYLVAGYDSQVRRPDLLRHLERPRACTISARVYKLLGSYVDAGDARCASAEGSKRKTALRGQR